MRAELGAVRPAQGASTELGRRFIDAVSKDGSIGYEMKSSSALRFSDVGKQIAKDKELVASKVFQEIIWVVKITDGPIDSRSLDALRQAGIQIHWVVEKK